MAHKFLLTGASLMALSIATGALAQDKAAPPADPAIPTVVVTTDSAAAPVYRQGQGADSGTTVYDAASIEARGSGTGDVLQILKQSPGVQFSIREGETRNDALRDLRPGQISISGGRPAENLFVLDGVSVNSQMETLSPGVLYSNTPDYDSVGAASPQTVWVDADLVGQVTLRDSNVSAEFGRFTGGVVEILTRDPGKRFSVSGGYSGTSDDLAHYHLSPSYSGAARELPVFERTRWNISADLPINEAVNALVSYSRQEATTFGAWSANLADLADQPYDETNLAETYLGKLSWEVNPDLKLSAQVTHSPYTSVYIRSSGINTTATSHGGGTTALLGAKGGRGTANWDLNLTWSLADNKKDAADWRFDVRGGLEPFCVGAITVTCENGHVGAIQQRQEDLALKGTWSQPFWGGDLRFGFEARDVAAEKSRRDGGVYSFSGTTAVITQATGPTTVCASATDISCVAGKYAFNRLVLYPAYDARASLQSYGLWSEFQANWRGFDIRTGGRFDYETFLGQFNFSPRFSISHDLPWGIEATLGVNRYYGRSYLGYAIREKLTNTLTYGRTFTTDGANRVWSPNWVLSTVTIPQRYSGQGLQTPYTDEASLNLSGPLFGGTWRVNGIYRKGEDQFARSLAESFVLVDELGVSRTINRYNLTNNGQSTYQGVNLSYSKPWRNNLFTFSTGWSDTKVSAENYYDSPDDEVAGSTLVSFQNEILSLADLLDRNQRFNFATPFLVNGDWNSKWFDDRLSVTLTGRFRDGFERIEQTTAFATVGGTRYRIYEIVEYKPSIDLDANVTYALLRGDHDVSLEARISNVLDKIPDRNADFSSAPWQLGRSIWFGVRVRY